MLDVTTTREAVSDPDGRSLDLYLGGPPDGDALLFHIGTPSAPVPYEPAIRRMAERGLRYVAFSRAGLRLVDAPAGTVRRGRGRRRGDGPRPRRRRTRADARLVRRRAPRPRLRPRSCRTASGPRRPSPGSLPIRPTASTTSTGWARRTSRSSTPPSTAPEALIVFKERSWPSVRNVIAAECADSFGDLIDDVDRAR